MTNTEGWLIPMSGKSELIGFEITGEGKMPFHFPDIRIAGS